MWQPNYEPVAGNLALSVPGLTAETVTRRQDLPA